MSNKSKEEQLDLSLKHSRFEFLFKLKRLRSRIEKNYTVLPFWRNGFIWAAIITIITISGISLALISKDYSKLPPTIPLLYNTIESKWESVPKLYIFSIPAVLLIIGFANIQLLRKVYYMNKKITLMICFMLSILYLLALIGTNEILLLSTS